MVEINANAIHSQEKLLQLARAATLLGTLQASYTNFHYLRPIWKQTTEAEALLGISLTGIANNAVEKYKLDLEEAAAIIRITNRTYAEALGIQPAARTTCIKPSGTASIVLGTSYGVHAWHDRYYKRRIEIEKSLPIYRYLREHRPTLVEDSVWNMDMAYFVVPLKAPDKAILRSTESPLDFLDRIKYIQDHWIKPGHVSGANSHNVSATVSINENNWYSYEHQDDGYSYVLQGQANHEGLHNEWAVVGEWLWKNRDDYHGLSVLPFDGGTYKQTPYETISEEEYEDLMNTIEHFSTEEIQETEDLTDLAGENACAGGACEL